MKGKILSVLFCLMLVFGMIFAACDNGAQPASDTDANKTVLDLNDPTNMRGTGVNSVNTALGL